MQLSANYYKYLYFINYPQAVFTWNDAIQLVMRA